MKTILEDFTYLIVGDAQANRIVPPKGFTVRLTVLAAITMAFLATIALSFSTASGRLADRWTNELTRSSTIRISAPSVDMQAQTNAVIKVLDSTAGVASYRMIEPSEQLALLAPWFGAGLDVAELPLPQLIELQETDAGIDIRNLKLRLSAEAPNAVFDDHGRWRAPMVAAANKLKFLGWLALGLIGMSLMIIISLAAQSALSANQQVMAVLRLIGARDGYIVKAFVRRFTLRSFFGACIGVVLGIITLYFMPGENDETGLFVGLRLSGAAWLRPMWVPIVAAIVAYYATQRAAYRALRELP